MHTKKDVNASFFITWKSLNLWSKWTLAVKSTWGFSFIHGRYFRTLLLWFLLLGLTCIGFSWRLRLCAWTMHIWRMLRWRFLYIRFMHIRFMSIVWTAIWIRSWWVWSMLRAIHSTIWTVITLSVWTTILTWITILICIAILIRMVSAIIKWRHDTPCKCNYNHR